MSDREDRLPQSSENDKEADRSSADPIIARAAGVEVRTDAHYAAIWEESQKASRNSQRDRAQWIKTLKRELGNDLSLYFTWVREHPLKLPSYIITPFELSIDLKQANWLAGNRGLLHLNSLLWQSIIAAKVSFHDLRRTYMSHRLGMVIHGRPLPILLANTEKCASDGLAVNSELLLALRYLSIDISGEMPTEKTAMLFAPLGKCF